MPAVLRAHEAGDILIVGDRTACDLLHAALAGRETNPAQAQAGALFSFDAALPRLPSDRYPTEALADCGDDGTGRIAG
jgi:hypothetical protein